MIQKNDKNRKIVVVTGGASGIGLEICKIFLKDHHQVHLIDFNKDRLVELNSESQKNGDFLDTHLCDVSSFNDLKAVYEKIILQEGHIDIWVNNAGLSEIKNFSKCQVEDIAKILNCNLMGSIYGTKLALEGMEHYGSGHIVNISSVAGHLSAPYIASYCAAKHGVVGFTRSVQEELKLKNSPIKLQLISPGFVDTKIMKHEDKTVFPEWLSFLIDSPEGAAEKIVVGMKSKLNEIYPSKSSKFLAWSNRLFPNLTRKQAKLLLTKKVSDLIFNRLQEY